MAYSKKMLFILGFCLAQVNLCAEEWRGGDLTVPDYAAFPYEEHIPNFPEMMVEDDQDLEVIEEYYRSVATACRNWA